MLRKNIALFLAGFGAYCLIELIWRGYTYVLMGCCGGLCVVALDKINDNISWDTPLELQAGAGSALITMMELVIGEIAKHTALLPIMWDYADIPLNYDGVICLPFSMAWMGLSLVAVFMADAINYYVIGDEIIPHYICACGRIHFSFPKK